MKKINTVFGAAGLTIAFCLQLFSVCAQEKPTPRLPTKAAIEKLKKDVPRLMKEANVPGASIALVRDGKLVWSNVYGVMNTETKKPVTTETIFEANSLTKPFFGYAFLKLVDEGKFKLDTPVNVYLKDRYEFSDDKRIDKVTARMLLSHSSGLRSAHNGQEKLIFGFEPGAQFEYAPVGTNYLAIVMERMLGISLNDYMKQTLLGPLGMTKSSMTWETRYDSLRAYQHDWQGKPNPELKKWTSAVACCSLQTNAVDYAKFVIAVLNDTLLSKVPWNEMLKPQVKMRDTLPGGYWGLGWGLEQTESGKYFWHWGDGGTSKDYITANIEHKDALVFFANSENGLSFINELLDDALGGTHPGAIYLGYPRYDAPSNILVKGAMEKGAAKAMSEYLKKLKSGKIKPITEEDMNAASYRLLNAGKLDDAIVLFTQNTIDHPNSWNSWDSLAEAYMNKKENALAIKYYEKSLELNPQNTNGAEQLKKLKQ